MSDVLIPFGSEFLLLSGEQFQEALSRGRMLFPQADRPSEHGDHEVLDADGMAQATQIPASWFLEQARQKKIPHIRAGKYVRFRLPEVLDSLQSRGRHTDKLSVAPKKGALHQ